MKVTIMSNQIDIIKNLIENTNGKIASITFKKRTGKQEVTTRTIRTGVKRDVIGVGQKYNPSDYDLITIFDMNRDNGPGKERGRHLNIPLDSIIELRCGKIKYTTDKVI